MNTQGAGGTVLYHYIDGVPIETTHTNRRQPSSLQEQHELDIVATPRICSLYIWPLILQSPCTEAFWTVQVPEEYAAAGSVAHSNTGTASATLQVPQLSAALSFCLLTPLCLCVSLSAHCLWVSLPLCLCVSLSAHCRHLCLSVCSLSLCLSQVLSVAMGLSNGGVGPQSVKGLKSASVNGVDLTNSSWNHAWMMPGEAVPTLAVSLSTHCFSVSLSSHCLWVSVYSLSLRLSVYSQAEVWTSSGATKVAWKTATEANSNSSLSWFRTTFDLPTTEADTETETDAPGPAQVSYAMDLSSAQKVRRKLGSLSHFLTPI